MCSLLPQLLLVNAKMLKMDKTHSNFHHLCAVKELPTQSNEYTKKRFLGLCKFLVLLIRWDLPRSGGRTVFVGTVLPESLELDGERWVCKELRGRRGVWVCMCLTSEGIHTNTHTYTSSLIMSPHLYISSVELQQTVSDVARFVCVCVCVCLV